MLYNIAFDPPRKPGRSPAQPIKPMHGNNAATDWQYQNNFHDYHLVKNTNSALKEMVVSAINDQWMKGAKYMVMRYASKFL